MVAKTTLQVDRRMWPSAAPRPRLRRKRIAPLRMRWRRDVIINRRQPTGGGKNLSESMLISAMRVNDFTDLGWSWF